MNVQNQKQEVKHRSSETYIYFVSVTFIKPDLVFSDPFPTPELQLERVLRPVHTQKTKCCFRLVLRCFHSNKTKMTATFLCSLNRPLGDSTLVKVLKAIVTPVCPECVVCAQVLKACSRVCRST